MAYVIGNPKTKKAAKEICKPGVRATDVIFHPGLGSVPENGRDFLEGPHYPQPHTWYAEVGIKDGKITYVK